MRLAAGSSPRPPGLRGQCRGRRPGVGLASRHARGWRQSGACSAPRVCPDRGMHLNLTCTARQREAFLGWLRNWVPARSLDYQTVVMYTAPTALILFAMTAYPHQADAKRRVGVGVGVGVCHVASAVGARRRFAQPGAWSRHPRSQLATALRPCRESGGEIAGRAKSLPWMR